METHARQRELEHGLVGADRLDQRIVHHPTPRVDALVVERAQQHVLEWLDPAQVPVGDGRRAGERQRLTIEEQAVDAHRRDSVGND